MFSMMFIIPLDQILEKFPNDEILKADGLDAAVFGIEYPSKRLMYLKSRCIKIFMNDGMEEMDAWEHYSYNVEGAYVGEQTPIWMDDTDEWEG